MSRREYPRVGFANRNPKWAARPDQAPACIVANCTTKATHNAWIEVSYMRGDDVRSGPCCKAHSQDAQLLIDATEVWAKRNREAQAEGDARAAARRAQKAAT